MTKPRLILSAVVATLVLGLGPVLAASPASAAVHDDVSDFRFSSFVADYYLGQDLAGRSTLRTVEKLTAVFPQSDQNKGIVRKIPDTYRGANLHTKFVSISDNNGITKPYSVDDNGSVTTVSTGGDDYVHGSVTYTITYTQQNVAGAFADTGDDEFYWDTNGTAWKQPFASVTARVHVDPSLVASLSGHNACYRGATGSKATCDLIAPPLDTATRAATATPSAALFTASTGKLAAGQNMTVAIGFTAGTFTDAPDGTDPGVDDGSDAEGVDPGVSLSDPVWAEVVGGLLALVGFAGLPFALVRRFAFGQRDAKGRGIIIAEYDVPKGVNLLEAGSLVKRDATSIAAQIVSFAVRGNLRILDYPVTDSGAKYTLELNNTNGLDPEEGQLLTTLFPDSKPGAVREIVSDSSLATQLSALKTAARDGLVTRGWRAKASAKSGVFLGLGLLGLFILEIVYLVVIAAAAQATSVWAVVALPGTFISMLAAFATAYRGTVITAAGAEQRDYLLGMQVYLQLAEEDRLRMLQSPTGAERVDYGDKREVVKLYEKLLPFAVLFGVEDQWSKVLAIQYGADASSPDWFVSTSAFNSALFVSSLSGLSGAVTTSVTPASSGISGGGGGGSSFGGSFGGGFSGGGGGGGGGGGR